MSEKLFNFFNDIKRISRKCSYFNCLNKKAEVIKPKDQILNEVEKTNIINITKLF
jgi:putative ribosome biogenesis GTPase RsgA